MVSSVSVNLTNLTVASTDSAQALIKLSLSANGPLRLQKRVENGVTVRYLGVRTWSTYFFETFIAWPAEISKAKLKTQKAIDMHVRPFLYNSGIPVGCSAESITAALQAKVVGQWALRNPFLKKETTGCAAGKATHEESGFVETKAKLYRGTGTVPEGISLAVVPPLQMIADVRLVTAATFAQHPQTDSKRGATYQLSSPPRNGKMATEKDFRNYYLENLRIFAGPVQTSLVMELQQDSEGKCSQKNCEGAVWAVEIFTQFQKSYGKQVSVMLTVPALPSVDENSTQTKKPTDARSKDQAIYISL